MVRTIPTHPQPGCHQGEGMRVENVWTWDASVALIREKVVRSCVVPSTFKLFKHHISPHDDIRMTMSVRVA